MAFTFDQRGCLLCVVTKRKVPQSRIGRSRDCTITDQDRSRVSSAVL